MTGFINIWQVSDIYTIYTPLTLQHEKTITRINWQ